MHFVQVFKQHGVSERVKHASEQHARQDNRTNTCKCIRGREEGDRGSGD